MLVFGELYEITLSQVQVYNKASPAPGHWVLNVIPKGEFVVYLGKNDFAYKFVFKDRIVTVPLFNTFEENFKLVKG
jgi:hypothetical protein